jgi:hypothetical protein
MATEALEKAKKQLSIPDFDESKHAKLGWLFKNEKSARKSDGEEVEDEKGEEEEVNNKIQYPEGQKVKDAKGDIFDVKWDGSKQENYYSNKDLEIKAYKKKFTKSYSERLPLILFNAGGSRRKSKRILKFKNSKRRHSRK